MYDSNDYEFDYYHRNKKTLEQRLEKYRNRMELIRTIIGVVVLGIQIVILYHLINK